MNPAQGRPKPSWPPWGAESHTQWANVGAINLAPGRPKPG